MGRFDIDWNLIGHPASTTGFLGTINDAMEQARAEAEARRRYEENLALQHQQLGANESHWQAENARALAHDRAAAEMHQQTLEMQRQQHLQGLAQAAAPGVKEARAALDSGGDLYGANAAVAPFQGRWEHVVNQGAVEGAQDRTAEATNAGARAAGQLTTSGIGQLGGGNLLGFLGSLPEVAASANGYQQAVGERDKAQADQAKTEKGAYRYTDATGASTMYDPIEAARSRDAYQGAKLDSSLAALGNDATMAPIAKGLTAAGSTTEEAVKAGLARRQHLEDQANADLRAEAMRHAAAARHNDESPDLAYRKEKDMGERRIATDLAGTKFALAASPEEGKKIRDMHANTNTLVGLVGDLKADIAANGTLIVPFTSVAKTRNNLQKLIVGKVTEAMASGVLNGTEFPRYMEIFDPKFWNSKEGAIHVLDAFEKEVKVGYEKKIASQATGSRGAPAAAASAPSHDKRIDDAMAQVPE